MIRWYKDLCFCSSFRIDRQHEWEFNEIAKKYMTDIKVAKNKKKHLTIYNSSKSEVEKILKNVLFLVRKLENIESQVEEIKIKIQIIKIAMMTNLKIQTIFTTSRFKLNASQKRLLEKQEIYISNTKRLRVIKTTKKLKDVKKASTIDNTVAMIEFDELDIVHRNLTKK